MRGGRKECEYRSCADGQPAKGHCHQRRRAEPLRCRRSRSRRRSAAVRAAEHELLGQRGARRRRGIGRHRDGLGDAAGERRSRRRPLDRDLLVARARRACPRARARGPTPSGSAGGPRPRSRSAGCGPSRPARRRPAARRARARPATIGWPCGQVVASPIAAQHALLEPRRHRVLHALGLLVDLVPRDAQDVGQEALDQAVAADDRLGVLAAVLGERERLVLVAR